MSVRYPQHMSTACWGSRCWLGSLPVVFSWVPPEVQADDFCRAPVGAEPPRDARNALAAVQGTSSQNTSGCCPRMASNTTPHLAILRINAEHKGLRKNGVQPPVDLQTQEGVNSVVLGPVRLQLPWKQVRMAYRSLRTWDSVCAHWAMDSLFAICCSISRPASTHAASHCLFLIGNTWQQAKQLRQKKAGTGSHSGAQTWLLRLSMCCPSSRHFHPWAWCRCRPSLRLRRRTSVIYCTEDRLDTTS